MALVNNLDKLQYNISANIP